MYIISKVGKKWLFSGTLICAGIACCCAAITEGKEDILWLKITFIMIGEEGGGEWSANKDNMK